MARGFDDVVAVVSKATAGAEAASEVSVGEISNVDVDFCAWSGVDGAEVDELSFARFFLRENRASIDIVCLFLVLKKFEF
jgi:hypothetical protein